MNEHQLIIEELLKINEDPGPLPSHEIDAKVLSLATTEPGVGK